MDFDQYVEVNWSADRFLSIAAHSIHTRTAFLALVAAAPTVSLVKHWIQALPFAAYLRVLAFVPTLAAIDSVRLQIHALLLAAVPPCAACSLANPRVFVTGSRSSPSGKEAACSPKGGFRLA